MIRKKILLLGDFGVGKSSMIRRYVYSIFDDSYLSTIGVKISKKILCVNNLECELHIWDVEGATISKNIPLSYFKGACGAIFVGSIDREETIESLTEHINTFLMLNPDAEYVIAYNKSDLLSTYQKEDFQLPNNTFLTSAKTNNNLESLFTTLTQKILI